MSDQIEAIDLEYKIKKTKKDQTSGQRRGREKNREGRRIRRRGGSN